MANDRKAFALRMDPALYDAIARLANADLRSVNAEVEFLLRDALARRGWRPSRAKPNDPEDGGDPT